MRQNLVNSLLLGGFALLSVCAQDQPPAVAAWDIYLPSSDVLSGQTLTLSARARNEVGATLSGVRPRWRSLAPAIASVDETGVVTGLMPGFVEVEASDAAGVVTATVSLQVNPLRVDIEPSELVLETGQSATVSAKAFDAAGKVIPGVRFRWYSSLPGTLEMDESGRAKALQEGAATISAVIETTGNLAAYTYSSVARIRRKADYKLTRLRWADQELPGPSTVSDLPVVALSGDAAVASVVSLSSGGQSLLLSLNGQVRTLARAGEALPTFDGVIRRFANVTVNDNGDVAAVTALAAEWCDSTVLLFRAANQWKPEVAAPRACGHDFANTRAMSLAGDLVYQMNGVYVYRKADGTSTEFLKGGMTLPGGFAVTNFNGPQMGAYGTAFFWAFNERSNWTLFSYREGQYKRLLGYSDNVEGLTVSNRGPWPVEPAPGQVLQWTGGSNWSAIASYTGGTWKILAKSSTDTLCWVHGGNTTVDSRGGSFAFLAEVPVPDQGCKTALVRWKDGAPEVLTRLTNWDNVSAIRVSSAGTVMAFGSFGQNGLRVRRYAQADAPLAVLETGSPVAGAGLAGIPAFSATGAASITGAMVKNSSGTVVRTSGSSTVALVSPGDKLPSGETLLTVHQFSGNRNGDIALLGQTPSNKYGLYAVRGGKIQTLLDTSQKLGSRNVWGFGTWSQEYITMGPRGQVAALVNAEGQELFVFPENGAAAISVARQGNPAPGGSAWSWLSTMSFDDNGRLYFSSNLAEGRAFFVWENGQTQRLLTVGQAGPDGRVIQSFVGVTVGGNRVFLRADVSNQPPLTGNSMIIYEYDGAKWRAALTNGETLDTGQSVWWGYGPYLAANSRGELATNINTNLGPALITRRQGQKDRNVASLAQRGPGGEYFTGLHELSINDAGEVFFNARVWIDGVERAALYQATPQ